MVAPDLYDGECCTCCTIPAEGVLLGENTKSTMAWMYTPGADRWDLLGIGQAKMVGDVEIPATGATAVTIGKYGEIITAQDGTLKTFIGNINDSTDGISKPWEWHSKDMSFGLDGQKKMYKSLKVRANGYFAYDNIKFYVDGVEADLEKINTTHPGGDLLNTWYTYEWKVAKASRKGRICSIDLGLQPTDSQVESMDIVYRRKPVK